MGYQGEIPGRRNLGRPEKTWLHVWGSRNPQQAVGVKTIRTLGQPG